MVEPESPDDPIKELPFPQASDHHLVEFLVFEHPQNALGWKNIPIKDILFSYKLQYLLAIARTQNITERFEFVDCVVPFEEDGWLLKGLWNDCGSPTGVARVHWIFALDWGVEETTELTGSEPVEGYVHYLGVFVATERYCAFGNIQQNLQLKRGSGSISDYCLADIWPVDDKFFDFSFYL